jgi:hypothetical protein
MRYLATPFVAVLVLMLGAIPAYAQLPSGVTACDTMEEVTIDRITAIPQANIDQLNALGAAATATEIHQLLTNEFDAARRATGAPFRCVRVTGVVLTDPYYSGLASMVDIGGDVWVPGRIHFYLRDIDADPANPAGMTIQVVDETRSGNSLNFRVGDVIELEGWLQIFGGAPERNWQLKPINAAAVGNVVVDFIDPNDPLLDPVVVTTDDINKVVGVSGGDPVVQANWDNWNALNGQYVRVEGAVMTNSTQADRPNFAFSSVGEDSRVGSRDLSLRYRNDRIGSGVGCPSANCYPSPPYYTRPADDPFIVPPPGAIIDVQGFLAFGAFDAFNIGQPQRAYWFLAPITDDDLVITASPPIIGLLALPGVPTGPITVTAEVIAPRGDALTSVNLHYEFSTGVTGAVPMTVATGENRYEATIPVTEAEHGAFVSYYVTAEDAEGLANQSAVRTTRVLPGGITQIAHIQQTASGGEGPSPFVGLTLDMDLEVVVMTEPGVSGLIAVQDGTNPWSGVFIQPTEELRALLERGMRVHITRAQIVEHFDLTRLVVGMGNYTVVGEADPYPYITGLTTADLRNRDLAERYEGMAIRFSDVVITAANADAPSDFGEFAFSSDGTAASQVRARTGILDASSALPRGTEIWQGGEELEYIQGIWAYTHGNFKLLPETTDDIGYAISTEEGTAAPQALRIDGTYPNPMGRQGTVAYTLARDGHVTLEVFDVTGRRVAVLFDGVQTAGSQQAPINASALASGLYVVRLAADGEVQTAKLVVTR